MRARQWLQAPLRSWFWMVLVVAAFFVGQRSRDIASLLDDSAASTPAAVQPPGDSQAVYSFYVGISR